MANVSSFSVVRPWSRVVVALKYQHASCCGDSIFLSVGSAHGIEILYRCFLYRIPCLIPLFSHQDPHGLMHRAFSYKGPTSSFSQRLGVRGEAGWGGSSDAPYWTWPHCCILTWLPLCHASAADWHFPHHSRMRTWLFPFKHGAGTTHHHL